MKLLTVKDETHKEVKTMAVKEGIKLNEATELLIQAGFKAIKKGAK